MSGLFRKPFQRQPGTLTRVANPTRDRVGKPLIWILRNSGLGRIYDHWTHGRHNQRFGWSWVVGGGWYFYPIPVYPYPNPFVPSIVVEQPPSATAAPVPQNWYYCDNPAGYYPYIAECRGPWKAVPVTPEQTQQPANGPPSPVK